MRYITTLDEKEYNIEVIDEHRISVNGQVREIDFQPLGEESVYSLVVDGKSFEADAYRTEEGMQVLLRGRLYTLTMEDEHEKHLRAAAGGGTAETGDFHLKAPMPGLVVSIAVQEGDKVEKGQLLVILESMKMHNELKSPRAGTVSRVRVKTGERVEQRQTLLSVQ